MGWLLGNFFWREGLEAAFGPDRRGVITPVPPKIEGDRDRFPIDSGFEFLPVLSNQSGSMVVDDTGNPQERLSTVNDRVDIRFSGDIGDMNFPEIFQLPSLICRLAFNGLISNHAVGS